MFKVQHKMCATCIYRPNSVLDTRRLEAQIADPHCEGFFTSYRACHHAGSGDVCCRGFWDRHSEKFALGQIAKRINAVEFVNIDDQK